MKYYRVTFTDDTEVVVPAKDDVDMVNAPWTTKPTTAMSAIEEVDVWEYWAQWANK